MTQILTVKEYTLYTWQDYEALFGKHKGVRGGCWCTFYLCTSSQYDKMTRDERKQFQLGLVNQGLGSGLIVYDQETPVAWCQFGPAERFLRYDRMKAYQELNLPAELHPHWRISCILVDKHRRREGLSQFALHSAVELIRSKGGGVVESFPLDLPNIHTPQFSGSERMFKREGFSTVARLGKNILLMRLVM